MTEQIWKYHTPERDGHAPDDWVEGMETEYKTSFNMWEEAAPSWCECYTYRYRPLQDAKYEPDLLAQCLRLPQDQREALIEAMQKPQRDWADEVFLQLAFCWDSKTARRLQAGDYTTADEACVRAIRSMCRPKEELQKLIEATEAARALIGAKNDGLTEAAKASNINQAWHTLNAAIREALS